MFKYVHHVHYVVRNRDEMVAYMEKSFGLKPERLDHHQDRGMKDALYRVGQTLIEITEPTKPDSDIARHLQKNGPGVYHVSFAVDNIQQVARGLLAKGNRMRGEDGVTQSPRGYLAANINQEDSLDIWFQMSEDPK